MNVVKELRCTRCKSDRMTGSEKAGFACALCGSKRVVWSVPVIPPSPAKPARRRTAAAAATKRAPRRPRKVPA